MLDRAREILTDLCAGWGGAMLEANGEADHLHALVELPPNARPSDFVNNTKTVLSRRLRSEFPTLRAAYKRPVLWSPSYCLLTAGGAPVEILRQYVEDQNRPD